MTGGGGRRLTHYSIVNSDPRTLYTLPPLSCRHRSQYWREGLGGGGGLTQYPIFNSGPLDPTPEPFAPYHPKAIANDHITGGRGG